MSAVNESGPILAELEQLSEEDAARELQDMNQSLQETAILVSSATQTYFDQNN